MPNIKKNLILQTCYQVLNIGLPLITAPYLARVLGPKSLGVFSYTASIVAYFTLFAMLGTINYGTRTIAAVRHKSEQINKLFWSIYSLQFLVSLCCIILYAGYLFFQPQNFYIVLLQGLLLIGCLLDISWLFFGLEDFVITATRSIIVKISTLILIFCLVKTSADLWVYTLIMSAGTILSQAILWISLPKNIHFEKISLKEITQHIKPNLLLFVPLLAMSVYHIMDKTMLGLLSTYEQTGFYYNADKLINIPIGILSGVLVILLPRMTALVHQNQDRQAKILFSQSLESMWILGTGMMFGMAAIASVFIPWFLGKDFSPCILLTILLAPIFLIKGVAFTIRSLYLIPTHKEKLFTLSIVVGAVSNLFLNIFLIPRYGALGAVIGTLLAELLACIVQIIVVHKFVRITIFIKDFITYLIIGFVMFLLVKWSIQQIATQHMKIVVGVSIGCISYSLIILGYWHLRQKRDFMNFCYSLIPFLKNSKGDKI